MSKELLHVEGLAKAYRSGGRHIKALDDVALTLATGETLGVVGASGSGKSTLSRVLLRLIKPDAGLIRFESEDWLAHRGSELRRRRARMQMVFQDTLGAFHPQVTAGAAISEPLRIHRVVSKTERPAEVERLLERVGLTRDHAIRPVRELSGGQRQRVAIARAIASRPALLVLDEAVSALDPTVRERILGLLVALQADTGVACLFISHDLAVVRAVSHRIAVMDEGRIVEIGTADDVVRRPQSAAAQRLILAVPRLHTGSETEEAVS